MNKQIKNATTRERQKGVTLVELMISLVLGMLLTAGVIKVFVGNHTTYEFNQGLARIQENARFTLNHIAYNTRMAGYSGCLSDVNIYNNLEGGTNTFRDDIQNGVQGYNANGTAENQTYSASATNPAPSPNATDWTPSLPADLAGEVIPGSDVLVVRNISADAQSLVSPFTNAAQLFVDTPNDFMIGEILVVSDCQKASIFQVTNLDNGSVNVVHSNTNTFTPGNIGPNWGPEQNYGLGAELARLQAYAFYVGEGENGAPALFQLRLQRLSASPNTSDFVAEELVEGIESMQVRYGVDTDNNTTVDSWVSADAVDAVGDWTGVLSVEVTLLARAPEEYGTELDTVVYNMGGATKFDPVDDRRFRQVFSTTVGIRNRLP